MVVVVVESALAMRMCRQGRGSGCNRRPCEYFILCRVDVSEVDTRLHVIVVSLDHLKFSSSCAKYWRSMPVRDFFRLLQSRARHAGLDLHERWSRLVVSINRHEWRRNVGYILIPKWLVCGAC